MNLELEQSTEVVNEAESAPAVESNSSEKGADVNEKLTSSPETKPDNTPFHEHPRFKELIQQKNEFASRFSEQTKLIQDLQSKLEGLNKPKAEDSPEAKLINRLKGVDPEFGTWAEQQEALRKELSDLKEWKSSYEKQTYITSAKATVDRLQSELKVEADLHDMYLSRIPMGTPIDKVAEAYKAQHDKISKLFESRERAALSKYSTDKKVDSKVPTAAKGNATKSATKKFEYSKDPEEARSQMIKRAISMARESD